MMLDDVNLQLMFDFVNKKQQNKIKTIAHKPQFVFGHTKQSPQCMINQKSIFFQAKMQPSKSQYRTIQNKTWTKPCYLTDSQQQKQIHFKINSKQKIKQDQQVFSKFLDKNKHYKSLSKLYESSKNNNLLPHLYSQQSNKSTKINQLYNHTRSLSNLTTIKSKSIYSFKNETKLNYQKMNIRNRRQILAQKAQQKIKLKNFNLPSKGVEHQLFFVTSTLKQKNKKNNQNIDINDLKCLDQFDFRISRMIK